MNTIQHYIHKKQKGFTIVELLIVIVVIAILAAIGIVAYTGIQGRAHDTAVQNDLRNIGQKVQEFRIVRGHTPESQQLENIEGLSVSHGSYSGGLVAANGEHNYNLLFCTSRTHDEFALVAWSRSDQGYIYENGGVCKFNYGPAVAATTCARTDVTQSSIERRWMYNQGQWRI